MKTMKMMECSIEHLCVTTRDWLENPDKCFLYGIAPHEGGYASSTHRGQEGFWQTYPVPHDLLHVLRYANANGFDWLTFQTDGDQEPNLPFYKDGSALPELPGHLNSKQLSQHNFAYEPVKRLDGTLDWTLDPTTVSKEQLKINKAEPVLEEDGDYILSDGHGVWISVAGAAINIKDHQDNLSIATYVCGYENDEPLKREVISHGDIEMARENLKEKESDTTISDMADP